MNFNRSVFLICLLLSLLPALGFAEVTLEIMDFSFPEKCGASRNNKIRNNKIESCNQCHSSWLPTAEKNRLMAVRKGSDISNRDIASLEENDRITVSVPDINLTPGQSFTQEAVLKSSNIMYVYGYCKYGERLQILDMRWIRNSSQHLFSLEHDGVSFPLLNELGDYIFVLKLLHHHYDNVIGDVRWGGTVLIWTVKVSDDNSVR